MFMLSGILDKATSRISILQNNEIIRYVADLTQYFFFTLNETITEKWFMETKEKEIIKMRK